MVYLVAGVTDRVGGWYDGVVAGGGGGEGRKGMGMMELRMVDGGKRRW